MDHFIVSSLWFLASHQCNAEEHDDYYMYGCYEKDFADNNLIFNDKDNVDWDDFANYQKKYVVVFLWI